MNRKQAFTLIEVLAALLILALLILSLDRFVFGMGELWGQGGEARLFNRHVNAVTHHIQGMFMAANISSSDDGELPIGVLPIRTEDGRREDMLSWEVPAMDDVMVSSGRPQPTVVCAIEALSGQGLLLYWHSKVDKDFATGQAHTVVLTPYCSRMEYDYYDGQSGSWRNGLNMEKDSDGKWRLPMRLRLYFVYENLKTERMILIPTQTSDQGLPAF